MFLQGTMQLLLVPEVAIAQQLLQNASFSCGNTCTLHVVLFLFVALCMWYCIHTFTCSPQLLPKTSLTSPSQNSLLCCVSCHAQGLELQRLCTAKLLPHSAPSDPCLVMSSALAHALTPLPSMPQSMVAGGRERGGGGVNLELPNAPVP